VIFCSCDVHDVVAAAASDINGPSAVVSEPKVAHHTDDHFACL